MVDKAITEWQEFCFKYVGYDDSFHICSTKQQQQLEANNACEHQNIDENSNEENKNNRNGIIVLGVYIHCEGCSNDVLKCLRGFEGVEGIEIDANNNKVTVKGKKADPIKVAERVRKKTGKHVKLISPKPKKEEVKEEKKPELEKAMFDVGVQTVDPNMEKNLVTVKGTMDPHKLVEFISKRGGRRAEIVKQINNEKRKEEIIFYRIYPTELVYAPQLFSDENPNSCSLM
ncbi:hypothetical protein DH2020_003811 [Rehmannia glutinosa]|uniref:HMA domain-containing protein n=1 Tax=Rehmannia glutinosa TaxID=99300 RepID=A0ABR0XMU6_REHGL